MNRFVISTLMILLPLICQPGAAQSLDQTPEPTMQTGAVADTPDSLLLDDATIEHIQNIYTIGQVRGNRTAVFSKVGDSLTVSSHYLYPFGVGRYDLGDHTHLEDIVELYAGTNAHIGNAFVNRSMAAHEGWSAHAALDPALADVRQCLISESPLECEYRLASPAIALIMFGTNDAGYRTPLQFEQDIRTIIEITERRGIIPVISTIPHRPDAVERVLAFNTIIRDLGDSYHIPVIDLFAATVGLPNYGLTYDGIHLSSSPRGMTDTATFREASLQYGYVVRNLLTLEALFQIHRILQSS